MNLVGTTSGGIRKITVADERMILNLLADIDLFAPEEMTMMQTLLEAHLRDPSSREIWMVDLDTENRMNGVAYCVPERMTDGAWNLLLIAVRPEHRGTGRGTALLQAVEALAKAEGGRILLVETSATDGFQATRRFYTAAGYTEEARIRDFYRSADDKVIYRKLLL